MMIASNSLVKAKVSQQQGWLFKRVISLGRFSQDLKQVLFMLAH